MKPWIVYALVSMLFAGCTSVIAKLGLVGITAELGLTVRTVFVFALVLAFAAATVPLNALGTLTRTNLLWLAASAATTTVSWIFYYKAIKVGEVSTVALIDKGSMVVAVLLAWWLLREQITARTLVGAALMLAGLLVIAKK
jgi:transporter family protein